jgi:SAM-dependent methyltransferase
VNAQEYDRMYELEDRYWWFVGRRNLALRLLNDHLPQTSSPMLDLGCGTGVILGELNKVGKTIGLDFSKQALDYCVERKLSDLIQANGEYVPLQNEKFRAVVALDIIEHVEHDEKALHEVFRVLEPGGIFVASVPAFSFLWGPHDVALHHFRRYTKEDFSKKLKDAGFEVVKLSYAVFFLFPITWMVRMLEKRRKGEAEAHLPSVPGWMNKLLIGLQSLEANLIRKVSLPWGSSVIVVAKKPR